MTVTLKELAQRLKLAPSTVSMALNNDPRISEKTRARVQKMAKRLQFTPNIMARGMAKRRTYLMGLVITDIMSSFFPQIIQGIEDTVRQQFYSILLTATRDDPEMEQFYVQLLRQKRVDGVVIEPVQGTENLSLWKSLRRRFRQLVTILRRDPLGAFPYVGVNNFSGGYLAGKYLAELGYRHLTHLNGPKNLLISEERWAGFAKALKEHGVNSRSVKARECRFSHESGYEQMKGVLKTGKPDAVFCSSDIIAVGAIRAISEHGYQVPEQVAVLGFDDLFFSSYTQVPLSTIAQPKYELGVLAAERLLDLMAGKKVPPLTLLEPTLVVRDSCGAKIKNGTRRKKQ